MTTPFDPTIFVAGRMLMALAEPIPLISPRALSREEQMAAMAFLVRYWLDRGLPQELILEARKGGGVVRLNPERLAQAIYDALNDRGEVRIHADSWKELMDVATAVAGEYEEGGDHRVAKE